MKINSIFFATFSVRNRIGRTSINGMVEPTLSVFRGKAKSFTLIEQPHPGSDTVVPFVEVYQGEKLTAKNQFFLTSFLLYPLLKLVNSAQTSVVFKVRDFFSVVEFTLKGGKEYDLFIGLEAINALAGILLKKFGFFKIVVYYVSDFSTNRYKPRWFNDLYLFLDRFAATHADFIWDVSPAMHPARIQMGLNPQKSAPVIHVPNALFPEQITHIPQSKTIPNSLVFVGTLGKINGPDLAIKTLKVVLKKIPSATLHIYGDGEPDFTRLVNLAEKLKLRGKVFFHGFISNQVKLSQETGKHMIAMAPYLAVKGSPRWWADATKIRLYLAAGLPVITTRVPPLGKEVEKDGAGLIANDTPHDQAIAVIKLLKNMNLYKKMKANAIRRAKNNTWENTYSHALTSMGYVV